MLSYLFNESTTAYELMHLEWASAVRTLLSLFNQPFSHAIFAAQFTAAWTNDGVFDLAIADEAFKKLQDNLSKMFGGKGNGGKGSSSDPVNPMPFIGIVVVLAILLPIILKKMY